jgi:hypothetical protein
MMIEDIYNLYLSLNWLEYLWIIPIVERPIQKMTNSVNDFFKQKNLNSYKKIALCKYTLCYYINILIII